MATITISIGRNVGSVPMSANRWADFRRAVGSFVEGCASDVFVDGAIGSGVWEGVREDSATWVFGADDSVPGAWSFKAALSTLATMYGQEAVAVTVGTTEFVHAISLTGRLAD